MDQAHIHLLITHLPIFGSLCGAIVLAYGLWAKSNATNIAAYLVLLLSSIGAGIAYLTGEGAEEKVEHLEGVTRHAIHEHEHFALYALISLIVLGVAALIAWFLTRTRPTTGRTMGILVLLLALISFGLVARTGYLGGQIRHTEIVDGALQPAENPTDHHDGD
ncbi:MAG: hypothetical protein CFE23_10780 [Flavobacterium sp. BFFFF1]|nr:MAG: hypothetical protein CFE23_10780 [Flavobacterium sp. BFFFF1]